MALGSTRIGQFGQQQLGGSAGFSPADLDPVFWVDSSLSAVSGGKLVNLGSGGSALDAQFGSTTGTDTNDPTLLPHTGTNYLYTPGTANNYASTPDAAALDITGDIELEVIFQSPPDWTVNAGGNGVLIGKEAAANRSYTLRRLLGTTSIQFVWSADGSTASNLIATVAPPAGTNAIKVQHDVDNGSGGNTATFYTSSDYGVSYSVLGAPVVGAGTTSHFSGTAELQIGSGSVSGSLTEAAGWRRAIVRNGIGGTTVFDADFTTGITTGAQTTFTCTTGQTVTINRATSGRKAVAVTRPIILLGTDDYLVVSDNALINFAAGESFTVVGVHRIFGSGTSTSLISKRQSSGGAWWSLYRSTSGNQQIVSRINDGTIDTTVNSVALPAAGTLVTAAMVRDVTSDTLKTYVNSGTVDNSGTDTTTGTLSNTGGLYIGSNGIAVPTYFDGEFVAAAVFRRALTAAEISSIVAYYGAA